MDSIHTSKTQTNGLDVIALCASKYDFNDINTSYNHDSSQDTPISKFNDSKLDGNNPDSQAQQYQLSQVSTNFTLSSLSQDIPNSMIHDFSQPSSCNAFTQDTDSGDSILNQATNVNCSYTKKQFIDKIKRFKDDDTSTHIFLKSEQGSLSSWEHPPRRFLYVQIIKLLLHDLATQRIKLCQLADNNKLISFKYKQVTGTDINPKFYQYDKGLDKYIHMAPSDVCEYFSHMFQKVDRIKKTIKLYKESPDGKQNKISLSLPIKVRLSLYKKILSLLYLNCHVSLSGCG